VFKNEGRIAGASVDHCHSQLIGIPDVPQRARREQGVIYRAIDLGYTCPLCEDFSSIPQCHERLISESPLFAAICPPASRMPGETWICPREDRAHFDKVTDAEIGELTDLLRDVLNRLAEVFDDPDFNLIVNSAPFKTGGLYHWRIEILPRTTRIAGWELGTGIFINTMFPEDAARLLRESR
jgi:UDPglucose--hexose-1-phosphate uridylyltransferase